MFVVNPRIAIENVGDESLIVESEASAPEVVRLTGSLATTALAVQKGKEVSATSADVVALESMGVIIRKAPDGLSRRTMLTLGAVAGATGAIAIALPSAAVSLSGESEQVQQNQSIPAPIVADDTADRNTHELIVTDFDKDFGFEIQTTKILNFDPRYDYEVALNNSIIVALVSVEGLLRTPGLNASPRVGDFTGDPRGFFTTGDSGEILGGQTNLFLRAREGSLVSDFTSFTVTWDQYGPG